MVLIFFLIFFLFIYSIAGINTELHFIQIEPLSFSLMSDFSYYERATNNALSGGDPYDIREIGPGFLYPPPAMLVVEIFSHIQLLYVRTVFFVILNLSLMAIMIHGLAKYFGFKNKQIWYWYFLCFIFAPFLEMLQIGQINMITMFGLFLMVVWDQRSPLLGGSELAWQ